MQNITALHNGVRIIWDNKIPLSAIGGSLLLIVLFVFFFYISPSVRIGPAQPIPFSHRVHAGDKAIQCRFCHPYVDRSIHPGIPPIEKCLFCHRYIIADHPWIQKEHAFFNAQKSIPWQKVFHLPEHVLFNHQRHIKREIECQKCHGAVETMDRLKGRRFEMGFCVECHREKKAPLDCWLACHS